MICPCIAGETDEDFAQTVDLIKDYKLAQVHISQFYPRPGMLFFSFSIVICLDIPFWKIKEKRFPVSLYPL